MDARQNHLIQQAITIAIEVLSRLPDTYRPDSDLAETKELLDEMSPSGLSFYQANARHFVDALLTKA
jgi:hypothetical protein